MKYNQFLELSELLENENFLFEAPATEVGQLDTKRGNWFSRWGLMKSKLNKTAKKVQKQVVDQIIQKFLPKILETEREVAIQISELIKDQKQPKEIMQIMQKNLGTVANVQKQQFKTIYDSIEKFIANIDKKMSDKIDASKINEKNKLNLKNYWLLLTTQIKMNAFQHMSQKILEEVQGVIGTDKNAMSFYNATSPNIRVAKQTTDNIKQNVDKKKKELEDIEKEMQNAPEPPAPTTTETPAPTTTETPATSGKGNLVPGKKYAFKIGEKYYSAEIIEAKEDGSYTAYLDNQRETKYKLTKEMVAGAAEIK